MQIKIIFFTCRDIDILDEALMQLVVIHLLEILDMKGRLIFICAHRGHTCSQSLPGGTYMSSNVLDASFNNTCTYLYV
jgi:hypothetical protein